MLAYTSGLIGEFVLEDNLTIFHNRTLTSDNPFNSFFNGSAKSIFRTEAAPILANLTFWLDLRLWGLNPWGFRITSLFIHLLIVILLFRFFRKNLFNGDITKTSIATAFVALNPVGIHAITYVSGRVYLLIGLLMALLLILYASYRKSGGVLKLILLLLLSVISLFTNLSALAIFASILAYEAFILVNSRARIGLGGLLGACLAKSIFAPSSTQNSFLLSLAKAPSSLMINFSKIFTPVDLSPFVTPASIFSIRPISIVAGLSFWGIFITVFAILLQGKRKIVVFGLIIAIFFTMFLNIVAFHEAFVFGKLYPAVLGGAIFFAMAVSVIGERIRGKIPKASPEIILSTLILIILGGSTYIQNFRWVNEISLAREYLETENISAVALSSLAGSMLKIGEADSAAIYANRATVVDSFDKKSWQNLAIAFSEHDMNNSALWALERWSSIAGKNSSQWQYTAGLVNYRMGKRTLGKRLLKEAAEDYPPAQLELGRIYLKESDYERGAEVLEKAAEEDPFNAEIFYLLANAYEGIGDNPAARRAWHKYLELPGVKTAAFIGEEDVPGAIPSKYLED